MALIGKLPSTLASRAIHISLRRKTAVEAITPLRLDRLEHLEVLLRQAARWVADNASLLRNADPQTPITLHSRSADNWRPLLAIADVAGCDWPERARHSAEKLTAGRSGETSSVLLLDDIRQLFSARETGQISVCRLGTEPHRYGTQAVARVEERQAAYAKATCRALGAVRHRPNRRLDRQEMPQGLQALAV